MEHGAGRSRAALLLVVAVAGTTVLAGCQAFGLGARGSSCGTDVVAGTDDELRADAGFDRLWTTLADRYGAPDQWVLASARLGSGYQWAGSFSREQPTAEDVKRLLEGSLGGRWATGVLEAPPGGPWILVLGPDLPTPWADAGELVLLSEQLVVSEAQTVTPDILEQTCRIMADRLDDLDPQGYVMVGSPQGLHVFVRPDRQERARALVSATGRLDVMTLADDGDVVVGEPFPTSMDPTPLFSGNEIERVRPAGDGGGLVLELKDIGRRLLDDRVASAPRTPVAIVLDGTVIAIDHPRTGAPLAIPVSGDAAADLISILEHGSYALPVHETGALVLTP